MGVRQSRYSPYNGKIAHTQIGDEMVARNLYSMNSFWERLLFLYMLTLPFFGFSLLNVGERGMARLDWLTGLGLIAFFGLESLAGRLRVIYTSANIWIFLYICSGLISAASILGSTQIDQFIDYATKGIQLLIVTPLFFVITSLPLREDGLRRLVKLWVLLGFGVALHSIYQLVGQIFDLPFTRFVLTNPTIAQGGQSARTLFGYIQPTSIFREPSYMGAFLGPCFVFAMVVLLNNTATRFFFRAQWLNWLLAVVLALAILLSNSQAILAGLIVVVFLLFVSGVVRRRRLIRLLFFAIGTVLLLSLILRWFGIDFLTAFSFRFTYLILNILSPENTAQVTSFADRSEGIEVGLSVWRTHPLIGVGLGNLPYHTNIRAVTNNAWIQLLVEQGVLGFIALAGCFLTLLYELMHWRRSLLIYPFWRSLLTAMLFVLLLTMIDGLFTFNWTDPLRIFVLAVANLVVVQAAYTAKVSAL